jgi:hypothetical protein
LKTSSDLPTSSDNWQISLYVLREVEGVGTGLEEEDDVVSVFLDSAIVSAGRFMSLMVVALKPLVPVLMVFIKRSRRRWRMASLLEMSYRTTRPREPTSWMISFPLTS